MVVLRLLQFSILVTFLGLILGGACRGPQGDPGVTGSQGSSGTNGSDGSQGPQGVPGAPAKATAVQFCPRYAVVYPSTFPEFGLCIDDTLYAVYWDGKNSWLAEIPPGYYSSTSTTAPCNFTVKDKCLIQ